MLQMSPLVPSEGKHVPMVLTDCMTNIWDYFRASDRARAKNIYARAWDIPG